MQIKVKFEISTKVYRKFIFSNVTLCSLVHIYHATRRHILEYNVLLLDLLEKYQAMKFYTRATRGNWDCSVFGTQGGSNMTGTDCV
jgi:hypothetical protein